MNCSAAVLTMLLTAGPTTPVNCDLTLLPTQQLKRDILVNTNDVDINCQGGKLTNVIIQSPLVSGVFKQIKNITVENCHLNNLNVYGIADNGQGPLNVTDSRTNPNHTAYVQSIAPYGVVATNNTFTASGTSGGIYLGPGVTNGTFNNNTLIGSKIGVVIYLDAESAFNTVMYNTFDVNNTSRELIALDGSAKNHVGSNTFKQYPGGGVYLYRNCGEGITNNGDGAVRWQTPSYNLIDNNVFLVHAGYIQLNPAVWISKRDQGYLFWLGIPGLSSKFCDADKGYWPGLNTSSTNDNDLSSYNIVRGNKPDSAIFLNTEITYHDTNIID